MLITSLVCVSRSGEEWTLMLYYPTCLIGMLQSCLYLEIPLLSDHWLVLCIVVKSRWWWWQFESLSVKKLIIFFLFLQLIVIHDSARVIQCMVQYGSDQQRETIFEEIKSKLIISATVRYNLTSSKLCFSFDVSICC